MTADSKQKSSSTAADVIEYLHEHPDFFIEHGEVLNNLKLQHESGRATSLIEKQVEYLRKVNADLRAELQRLIIVARDNDRISEATHRLSLEIMQSNSAESVLAKVQKQMRDTFNVDYCDIISVNKVDKKILKELQSKLNPDNIFLGRLGKKCQAALLNDQASEIKSVACVYLQIVGGDLLFILGSKDSDRYQEGIGTHFLLHLGDLIVISLYQKANANK